jgi:glycosyltransferase involved in cell wall biosynthesis
MTKISAAIIARNREKEIESCLKSLRGVDEIVVLDTGSVDKTRCDRVLREVG